MIPPPLKYFFCKDIEETFLRSISVAKKIQRFAINKSFLWRKKVISTIQKIKKSSPRNHLFSTYAKIFWKANISFPLIQLSLKGIKVISNNNERFNAHKDILIIIHHFNILCPKLVFLPTNFGCLFWALVTPKNA